MSRALLFLATGILVACGRTDRAAPAKGRAADELLLAHLPADTDAIVAGSLSDLATWPLWRRAVGVIAHEAPGIAEQIATRCKLDPWTVIDSGALAFTGDGDGLLFAAEVTTDRKRLHGCATEVASEVALSIEDGPITAYRQLGSVEYAAWTSERRLLALPNRMDDPEVLRELLPERAVPVLLQSLVARAERGATVWGVALATGDGAVAQLVAAMPLRAPPSGVHGSIRRDKGLRVHVALVFAEAGAATEASRLFESLLADPPPWLVPWRDAIRVEAKGDEARVTLELDPQRAQALDTAVMALLPAPTERPAPPAAPAEMPAPVE